MISIMYFINNLVLCVLIAACYIALSNASSPKVSRSDTEDNEFAEFEDPDDPSIIVDSLKTNAEKQASAKAPESTANKQQEPADQQQQQQADKQDSDSAASSPKSKQDEEEAATVQTEDEDDFAHLEDGEEFEGFDKGRFTPGGKGESEKPDLKIAKIPIHLTTNWDSYYLELVTITGLSIYFLNFLYGKTKNTKLANAWFSSHKEFLESEFHIVGDDGKGKEPNTGVLMRDSEHIYSLWCSGRTCVEGMLVELRFIKRQDIVSLIAKLFKPVNDQIFVKILLDDDADWENFIFALAPKKRMAQLLRDHQDLAFFCGDKKYQMSPKLFELPESFSIVSECLEAAQSVLDHRVCTLLSRFESNIDYILISDQYSGPRVQTDDGSVPTKLPDTKRAIIMSLKVGRKGGAIKPQDMENVKQLFQLVMYLVDKTRKLRLSKEARLKSEKQRAKMAETAQKLVHGQRQEAAQLRREEKRKAEKERLLLEEDPDRARKLEDRDAKREAKKRNPKMKMLKVKGM